MYMTVSGAPVKKLRHAEPMSAMALDTIEAVKSIKNPANRKPMTVTIGKRSKVGENCTVLLLDLPLYSVTSVGILWSEGVQTN